MANSVIRADRRELSLRCGRLREVSRDLRARSQECRLRLMRAAKGVEKAANHCETQEADAAAHLARLVRAESELTSAIAECSAALAEVRRELEWRHPPSIVH